MFGKYPAKFNKNKKGDDKTVLCGRCSHACVIAPGQIGNCQVRKNIAGNLFSLVYGYPTSINIDPIEKKPLFHFQPGSYTFSIGTLGCNFHCLNCQNHDLSQAKAIETKIKKLNYYPPERIIEEAIGNDCQSIAYTYNEPTVFGEYALDIMKLARQHGLTNIFVSNGYMSGAFLEEALPYLDAVNLDIKSFADDFYRNNCGARVKPVQDNAVRIKRAQIHLEITTLVIPSLSDSLEMLENLANFIVSELDDDTPWHLLKFSPQISWKLKDIPASGDDIIYEAYEIGKEAGLKYIYVGNLPGDQKENTYCPKCGGLAIRRYGYSIDRLDNNGRCQYCDRNLDITE